MIPKRGLLSSLAIALEMLAAEPAIAESVKSREPTAGDGAPVNSSARVFGTAKAQLGVHTQWSGTSDGTSSENVVGLRSRANLGLDWKASESVRVTVEGRALWRGAAQEGLRRGKAYFEPTLGEAFVDLYTPHVDLRFGNQIVAFGANAILAPTDRLNPIDLRENFLSGDPEDWKLSVLAVRALGAIGPWTWTAFFAPFFTPDRYTVFGQDEALIQPALGLGIPLSIDPSIEDQLQSNLLETERPNAFPHLGDFGVRVGTEVGRVKLGLSWAWMNEKLPVVALDPQLAAAVAVLARGGIPDPSLVLSLQDRLRSGARLITGTYPRQHIFAAEASRLFGPVQIDLDLGFSPAQTFYDAQLLAIRKHAATLVLGVSQAAESRFLYALTYAAIAVPSLDADQTLFLLEPHSAAGARRTGIFHVIVATASYWVLDDRLQLGVRGAFEPVQHSFALGPRATYKIKEGLSIWAGVELYEGASFSPFGYYGRNDQIAAGVRADLF